MKAILARFIVPCVLLACVAGPLAARAQELFTENTFSQIKILNVIGMPVMLSNPRLTTDFGRRLSKIGIDISFPGTAPSSLELAVVLFSASGEVKSWESWAMGSAQCQAKNPMGGATPGHYSQVVKADPDLGDSLVIFVVKADTATGVLAVPVNADINPNSVLLAQAATAPATQAKSLLHEPALYCGPEFCNECADRAISMCGSRGVKQFQCVVSTCSCGFTCCQTQDSC